MDYTDLITIPIYFIFFLIIGSRIKNAYFKDKDYSKFFMPALSLKLLFAIVTGLVYKFYYKGGDTYYYFMDSNQITRHFPGDMTTFFTLLTIPSGMYAGDLETFTQYILFYSNPTAFFVVRVAALASIFGFGSYGAISLIFAFLSFIGIWLLYVVFVDNFPKMIGQMAMAVLFMPSILFWGSGLFKDTISIGCMGIFIYCFYMMFIKRKRPIFNAIMMTFTAWMLFKVKVYILMSLLPALLFWLLLHYQSKFKYKIIKILATPLLIAVSLGLGFLITKQISEESDRFSFDNIQNSVESMQTWHYRISEQLGGSGYSLEETDGSVLGVLSVAPIALSYTFFRPFLWEAKNLAMLMAAFESTFVLLLLIYLLYKTKIVGMFRIIAGEPLLMFSILFSLVFGFAVGYSSYNLGALSRYKIACMPFFIAALFIILEKVNQKRREKENEAFDKNIKQPDNMRAIR